MAVTVDAGARNSYYSAGNIGWSARSLFQYRAIKNNLVDTSSVLLGQSSAQTALGQSFTPTNAGVLTDIIIPIAKVGTPTDNLTCEIRSDDGTSKPSTTVLATASNLFGGAGIGSTSQQWVRFKIPSLALTGSTKYWVVVQRSGAVDASNYYSWYRGSSLDATGGRSFWNGSTWGTESATNDLLMQVLVAAPSALYCVTQDTSIHMWKSTDSGGSWSEIDSAHAPGAGGLTSTRPFSACDTPSGPFIGVAYFSAANTVVCRYFDMSTDLWSTADFGTTPLTDASNQRPIRLIIDGYKPLTGTIVPGQFLITFTSNADDADLSYVQCALSSSAWSAAIAILAITSAEKSTVSDVILDKAAQHGYIQRFYYDVLNDDFSYRSVLNGASGTEGDVDTTAADVDTEHASATYEIYQSGSTVDTAIIAFIDADGTLEERIATLELATPTFATQNQVSSDIGAAGRQLSSCQWNGVNYIAGCDGSNIDLHQSSTPGSWSSTLNKISGLTSGTLAQIIPVYGVGVLCAYTDNGDTKVEWLVTSTVTISVPLLTTTSAAVVAPGVREVMLPPAVNANVTGASLIADTNPQVRVSAPVLTATGAVVVPAVQVRVPGALLTGASLLVAPGVSEAVLAPVLGATGLLFAPNTGVQSLAVPALSATAAMLAPSMVESVTNALLTGSLTALAPAVALQVGGSVLTATAQFIAPNVGVNTIPAPLLSASVGLLVPALAIVASAPTFGASGLLLPPGVYDQVSAPLLTATGLLLPPDLVFGGSSIQPSVMTATGLLLPPSLGAGPVSVPVLTASGLLLAPNPEIVAVPAVATGSLAVSTPVPAIVAGAPVSEVTGSLLAPALRDYVAVPVSTATGQFLDAVPTLRIGAPVSAVSAAVNDSLVLLRVVPVGPAEVAGALLDPDILVQGGAEYVNVPTMTVTADLFVPGIQSRVPTEVMTGSGSMIAATVRAIVQAGLAEASVSLEDATAGIFLPTPVSGASAAILDPLVVSYVRPLLAVADLEFMEPGFAVGITLVPLAAFADLESPVLVMVVSVPVMPAFGELLSPVVVADILGVIVPGGFGGSGLVPAGRIVAKVLGGGAVNSHAVGAGRVPGGVIPGGNTE